MNSLAPEPRFPLFVLIGDEQCFMQVNDRRELNDFEQPDIEELAHWAWDQSGRKYQLTWSVKEGVLATCVKEDDREGFRRAVLDYRQLLQSETPYGRCDPTTLMSVVDSINSPTS